MTATVIGLILAHIGYYTYMLLISHMMDIHGRITNTRNLDIFKFRTSHSVNICTYQNDASRNGFAWFKTIYLNEKLLRTHLRKKLFWVFYHELYHLQKKHKLKQVLMRIVFSLTPAIMLIAPLWAFFAVYFGLALLFSYIEKRFEILANKYAKQQITQS